MFQYDQFAITSQSFTDIHDLSRCSGLDWAAAETGYLEIDDLTGGFQKQNLIILAARPGVGKTSLALNVAQNKA